MKKIAILGAGNIGQAIYRGLVAKGGAKPGYIMLSNTNLSLIEAYQKEGCLITDNNKEAMSFAEILILSVEPQQMDRLLEQIRDSVDPEKHMIISIVSGVSIEKILEKLDAQVPVIRAMPNTAISIGESMTALACRDEDREYLTLAEDVFKHLGETIILREDLITAATALGSCGIAFFMRAIRAAIQGGIEIGLHSEDAKKMATQTAKGAAMLLLLGGNHPEHEIDKVTTPLGVTISGLNQMEHAGFSSAMIRGIVTAWEKAKDLY
ncbi:MAG: pyrroline-5-carboxylate reductase [FCB group bacterium]|nr:pyrroline-5-carboxylate reductase [FCB group bacterium]